MKESQAHTTEQAGISALTGLWQMSEFTKITQLAGNGRVISGQLL